LADANNVAISAITHPAKASGQRASSQQPAIDQFIGSQAFIAAARIGHICIEEVRERDGEQQPTGRILFSNAKNNPHPKMPTLAYRIEQVTIGQDEQHASIVAPRVKWEEGTVPLSADQAIAASVAKPKKKAESAAALALLERLLQGGQPVPVKEIERTAEGHGLTKNQIRRAKEKLPITAEKDDTPNGGWTWRRVL
jgi:hypothetical protein